MIVIASAIACGDSTTNGADSGSGGDAAVSCLDETGKYSITSSGSGCGALTTAVPICINQIKACTVSITTDSSGANVVSGQIDINADGSMTNATVQEAASTRTGCVGAWDAASSTLTIDCGGTGTSQSCRVTLVRTAASCN